MRVAIIVPAIKYLGPVKLMETLVNALSGTDMLIDVFYLDKICDQNIHMSVPVNRFKLRSFHFEDYDVIHTNGIRPDMMAFLFRKRIKFHVSTIHNFVFEDLKFTYNRIIAGIAGRAWIELWKKADVLVCVSESMKDFYRHWISPGKLKVILNGVPDSQDNLKLNQDIINSIYKLRSGGLRIIGTASYMTKRKGIDQLLRLLSEKKNFGLVIFGEGKELRTLVKMSSELKISSRCLFCGFLNRADKYFHLFDYFVMPSRSEGFGLSLIEAVSHKVPVICSDIAVFRELLSPDEVTFFKLEDMASLSKAFTVAETTGSKKVSSAYARYLESYTARVMAKQYYDLYQTAS